MVRHAQIGIKFDATATSQRQSENIRKRVCFSRQAAQISVWALISSPDFRRTKVGPNLGDGFSEPHSLDAPQALP